MRLLLPAPGVLPERYNAVMPAKTAPPVELDELLAAEFQYIAQTAIQANEDRARVSSFYLIAVGSLLAAMFGTQFFDPNFFSPTIRLMFSALFVLLTVLGASTVMQLARRSIKIPLISPVTQAVPPRPR